MRKFALPALFVLIAVALAVGSFVGGDISIICGWLWLLWTLPFGVIWQFYGYDHVTHIASLQVVQYVGSALVILVCYVFWFVALPILRRTGRT